MRADTEHSARAAVRALEPLLDQRGTALVRGDRAAADAVVSLSLDSSGHAHPEGYQLHIARDAIAIVAPQERGLLHGVQTLAQWIELGRPDRAAGLSLPCVRIDDHPAIDARGVMLDISRDRVFTMSTLRALVDQLAAWKLNQLQLYTEHTFAYAGHEIVWRDASPITPDELRALDSYCAERGIELVPNQNSLGHLHRWLKHEPYRELAECPEGIVHPFSDAIEPYSLCVTDPRSIALLADLYDQLLPCCDSRMVNVGLDEALDIGRCRSAAAAERRGASELFADHLEAVHRLLAERGRRMQCWTDMFVTNDALLARLPDDVIALEWGYEAGHPFGERARRLAASGRAFYLCPGTSSWNSLAGRTDNALKNLAAAARAAVDSGAAGYLVTDWGDNGHLQPLPTSLGPLLAGAGFAWNPASTDIDRAALDEAVGRWAFHDRALLAGEIALAAGESHRGTSAPMINGTALFWLLVDPSRALRKSLDARGLAHAAEHLAALRERLARTELQRTDGPLVRDELGWVLDLLQLATEIGTAALAAGCDAGDDTPLARIGTDARQRLAAKLAPLRAQHRPLWLARSRPGGRLDSARRLERLQERLED